MKLNCRVGDLAVHVNAKHDVNIGKFCTILKPIGFLEKDTSFIGPDGHPAIADETGVYWWVEYQTHAINNLGIRKRNHVIDSNLRPIRDPGEDVSDEMVLLCGNPNALEGELK